MLMYPGKRVFIVTYLVKVGNATLLESLLYLRDYFSFFLRKEVKRLKIWAQNHTKVFYPIIHAYSKAQLWHLGWVLRSLLRHVRSLVVNEELLVVACGI